jgi:hypothetical protein
MAVSAEQVPALGVAAPDYWQKRRDANYLQRVAKLVQAVGGDARSILDVGSNRCPYLDWFEWIPRRVSVDLQAPYFSPSVEGIKADFLTWQANEKFDLCLCLQVLEHVPDAGAFSRKLLASARQVIVSVPYLWSGSCKYHVHDPVDDEKIAAWFGCEPDVSIVVTETPTEDNPKGVRRMICYFNCRPGDVYDRRDTRNAIESVC